MKKQTMTKRTTPASRANSESARQRKSQRTSRRDVAPRSILVPVDFSDDSLRALELASSLARQFNAALVLVHVLDPIYTPGRFDSPRLRPLRAEAREAATAELAKLVEAMVSESPRTMKHQVIDGAAPDAILAFAKKMHVDWIVMGSKGQTGMKRLLAGSVAERVVRQATCPVLVVP